MVVFGVQKSACRFGRDLATPPDLDPPQGSSRSLGQTRQTPPFSRAFFEKSDIWTILGSIGGHFGTVLDRFGGSLQKSGFGRSVINFSLFGGVVRCHMIGADVIPMPIDVMQSRYALSLMLN